MTDPAPAAVRPAEISALLQWCGRLLRAGPAGPAEVAACQAAKASLLETIARLQAHYGFTRMPFGRDLAPGMLHRHAAHGEATARITWCVADKALGVITGEVGAGKTVAARAALAALDTT